MAKTGQKAGKKTKTKAKNASVENYVHEANKRKNIPTAELQKLVPDEEKAIAKVRYPRNPDRDPQLVWGRVQIKLTKEQRDRIAKTGETEIEGAALVWRGKDQEDESALAVDAPPVYIQEKIHPRAVIEDLRRRSKERRSEAAPQVDLFHDFNGLPDPEAKTEFYVHDQNWSNRMILGDSLLVMASLAERENLRGKVQMIYLDPPYGIKFNSNWQPSVRSRDVKDGKDDAVSREPEVVRAFRDTWKDGIHSYLSYLRDRLVVARDLLSDKGSIFVQISDANVHLVRDLLDETFGAPNFISLISFKTTSSLGGDFIGKSCDYILWYTKDASVTKYRELYLGKTIDDDVGGRYTRVQLIDFSRRVMTTAEREDAAVIADGGRIYRHDNLTSQSGTEKSRFRIPFHGTDFVPNKGFWKTNEMGISRLLRADRIAAPTQNSISYVRFLEPIRKELNQFEAFVARRLSMMRIMARRMKATAVLA